MKTHFNRIKRIVILIFAVGTLSSADGCDWFDDEEIDCSECIAAQKHYFQALQDHSCNTTVTARARTKVIDACPAGKAAYIVTTCQLGDVPSYTCE